MTNLYYVKHNKLKIIFGLFLLGVIYGIYKITSFFFGFGISFPPNKCDLVTGYELRSELMHSKRYLCLYNLAIEKQGPLICKNLSYGSDGCLREVAQLRNEVSICVGIKSNYDRGNCIYSFAERVIKSDINQALAICSKNELCRNKVIRKYQEINSIEGKTLVYRCLNYQVGDTITELLCKLNISYLINWQGHLELFYMYGKNYPSKGKKLCEIVDSLIDNQSEISWCYERVEGHIQEMSRVGSDFYKFLQENPNGLGEPK